jgi:peptidoglycan/LPS O-acetylase OafA/YrhL
VFNESKYRTDIQVLRALSVLAVVLFHASENSFPLGYLGVDVFFVISGFVVTPLILRIFDNQVEGRRRLDNLYFFYKRRFWRLAPALAVTLASSAIAVFLLAPIADYQRFAKQGIATLLLVGNLGAYRYSGDYFFPNPNPLVHTWSLSVEEQIYGFLPIALMLLLYISKRIKKVTAVLFGCISLISFVSFQFPAFLSPIYSRVDLEQASQFSFYSPIDRIWQFTLGGLAFLLLNRYPGSRKNIRKYIHLLVLIAVFTILFAPIQLGLKIGSLFATIFAITVILSKSIYTLPNFLIKKLSWIGDRSYSIYLVHMPVAYIAKYSPSTQIGFMESSIIQSLIIVTASILLGVLSYSRIENKYRDRLNMDSTRPSSSLKGLIYYFVIPMTLLLIVFLISFLSKTTTSMYDDRLDDGKCKFWTTKLDQNFRLRFLGCYSEFGRATVVLGDSHALNIYNSLFHATGSDFFVGIAAAGCRPNTQSDSCHYDDFKRFLKSSPDTIEEVIFHQSGSYLVSDKRGEVDSTLAFYSSNSYSIQVDDIQFLMRWLDDMGNSVATTWLGPFGELRVEPTWIQLKKNQIKPNPVVKQAFLKLEEEIRIILDEESHTFRYVSLSEILGYKQFEYKVGSCILFRDLDHWSTCGEKLFSSVVNQNLKK